MEYLIPIAVSLASSIIQQQMNRRDFDYTLSKTNIPAQVQQFRDAGLNPALAYGQISSPQAQSLGNYQSDFGQSMKDLAQLPQIKQQMKTEASQQRYYDALAKRTQAETSEIDFRVSHQEEVYQQEFERRALQNVWQNLENSNTYYRNIGQIAQNGILAIEKQIRQIDLSHHEEEVHSRIQQIVAAAALDFALAKTENSIRSARVANLRQQTRTLFSQATMFNTQSRNISAGYRGIVSESALREISSGYMDFLTDHNTDFSTLNARERWNTYGDDIVKGISTAISIVGGLIVTRGALAPAAASGAASTLMNFNDYGPGRDHLGH